MKKRLFAALLAVVLCLSIVGCGQAKPSGTQAGNAPEQAPASVKEVTWPDGTVNLIVAAKAGGGTDLIARKMAEVAKKVTGVNFVVVNQDEGGGAVAISTVYDDTEEGLTLGFFIPSFFTSYITGSVDENPLEDFKVASYVNRESCAYICVRADSPFENIEQLLESARENPNSVVFGTSLGSRTHFRVEEFPLPKGTWIKALMKMF